MLSSKFYYMVVGFDLAFSLLCARLHEPMTFGFLACAFLMNYIGDKRKEEENQPKGEN